MTWLARFEVDRETAYAERIVDTYVWHQRIWRECFAAAPEAKRDFLSRVDLLEKSFCIWLLGEREPRQPPWCAAGSWGVKPVAESFLCHHYYAFSLRANPTRCIDLRDAGGNKILRAGAGKRTKGKRVPIVKPEELRAWLVRKGCVRRRDDIRRVDVPGGFRIMEEPGLEISPATEHHFRKKEHAAYHAGVDFKGVLEVTDRERFIASYRAGIGGAKAFGFGLLLLAPVNLSLTPEHS